MGRLRLLLIRRIKSNLSRIEYELHELWVDIILKEESYKIIGACMEVHRELGFGFKEIILQRRPRD